MKKSALFLSLIFLWGCTETSLNPQGSNSSWQMEPLSGTSEMQAEIASLSPLGVCPHEEVYLAGITWAIVNAYSFVSEDFVEIREDCLFRTLHCGTLGYIISGGGEYYRGMVEVELVGHMFPKAGCFELGRHLCAYEEDGMGELRLRCELMESAVGPYEN